jgi:Uma2 family endonuclease
MVMSISYPQFSQEEYLEIEEMSTVKHEYIRGQIYAMAGASKAHVIIAGNLVTLLNNHLRGSGCIVYSADMKVKIDTANVFYYPDVTVTCNEEDRKSSENFIRHPCLIVEILSTKTEAFDRGDKFSDYQKLESLEEYILIDQKKMRIESFHRNSRGIWTPTVYEENAKPYFTSLNFDCPTMAIYENVELLT